MSDSPQRVRGITIAECPLASAFIREQIDDFYEAALEVQGLEAR